MSKIGLIGASTRVGAFVKILKSKFSGKHTIAGIMDCDPGKMKGFCEVHELQVPCYTDFDLFCKEVAPDTVIISTVDATHAEYVVKCLDRKISCIVEKPLCISLEQCREKGINESMIHEDFMIGNETLSIVGVCRDGSCVQIFKDGEWAF